MYARLPLFNLIFKEIFMHFPKHPEDGHRAPNSQFSYLPNKAFWIWHMAFDNQSLDILRQPKRNSD